MQKPLLFTSLLLILVISLTETACTSDQLLEPPPLEFCDTLVVSYNLQVKGIIDTNCAFSGCHVAGSSAPGNYSSFGSLQPFLTDREFRRFVIDLRNDPENWACRRIGQQILVRTILQMKNLLLLAVG